MSAEPFSSMAAIKFGWVTFQQQKKFWLLVMLLMLTMSGGLNFNFAGNSGNQLNEEVPQISEPVIQSSTEGASSPRLSSLPFVPQEIGNVLGASETRDEGNMGLIWVIVGILFLLLLPIMILTVLVSTAIQVGFQKLFLAAARGENMAFEIILSDLNLRKSARILFASFLYGVLVLFGLILFIIPGLYFASKYLFSGYSIVDRNVGIRESFRLSGEITRGNKSKLLWMIFLMLLLNILGLLALLYGLLVTVPVTFLAYAYAYDRLSRRSQDSLADTTVATPATL